MSKIFEISLKINIACNYGKLLNLGQLQEKSRESVTTITKTTVVAPSIHGNPRLTKFALFYFNHPPT